MAEREFGPKVGHANRRLHRPRAADQFAENGPDSFIAQRSGIVGDRSLQNFRFPLGIVNGLSVGLLQLADLLGNCPAAIDRGQDFLVDLRRVPAATPRATATRSAHSSATHPTPAGRPRIFASSVCFLRFDISTIFRLG